MKPRYLAYFFFILLFFIPNYNYFYRNSIIYLPPSLNLGLILNEHSPGHELDFSPDQNLDGLALFRSLEKKQ